MMRSLFSKEDNKKDEQYNLDVSKIKIKQCFCVGDKCEDLSCESHPKHREFKNKLLEGK